MQKVVFSRCSFCQDPEAAAMFLRFRSLLFFGFSCATALSSQCLAATAWVSECCNNPGLVSRYNTATHRGMAPLNSGAPTPASAGKREP